MAKKIKTPLPPYITQIYSWLYQNPRLYNILDNAYILNILTLGQHYVLTEELQKEIYPHSHILQIGVTMGCQIEKTYNALGMLGSYTIIDIISEQLENCHEKHLEENIKLIQADASKEIQGEYDTIICYMLLHELPPYTCAAVLNNIIKTLKPGGRAIFVDYHLPSSYNPLKYFIRAFNRLYQPFAEALWKNAIKELTPNAEKCTWSQQTYFGGIYQKVVATKTDK